MGGKGSRKIPPAMPPQGKQIAVAVQILIIPTRAIWAELTPWVKALPQISRKKILKNFVNEWS